MLKRAHKGTFHKISQKHLQRYVDEFVGHHNFRRNHTADQMTLFCGQDGRKLGYGDLIASVTPIYPSGL